MNLYWKNLTKSTQKQINDKKINLPHNIGHITRNISPIANIAELNIQDYHPYIPTNCNEFLDALKIALKNIPLLPNTTNEMIQFVDVGSGVGNVLDWFKAYMYTQKKYEHRYHSPKGIEYNSELVKLSSLLYTTELGDALKYKDYKQFNIIHYYCPIANSTLQKKLEEKIEKEIKPGSLIIARLKQSEKAIKNKKFKLLSEYNTKRYAEKYQVLQKITN